MVYREQEKEKIKNDTAVLEKKLKFRGRLAWDLLNDKEKEEAFRFAEGYKSFLDRAKTEREAVREIAQAAREAGFQEDCLRGGAGKKFFFVNKDKSIALAVLGQASLAGGIRIIVSHIDSPRIDLKQNPLYEDADVALLRTHYYGGIKKYQWVTIPLSLHGLIVKSDGSILNVVIGEDPHDPVFVINDLLPHLSGKTQDQKKLVEAIEGEKLTAIAGSLPFPDAEAKERIKLGIMELLHQKYGLIEEDFISSEIELVPAMKARDVGFDRSLIGSYGQDDRASVYTSLQAILSLEEPPRTVVALFVDKEEIGSDGNTGAKSLFLESALRAMIERAGLPVTEALLKQILSNSKAISADVEAALDPNYPEVHEKQNAGKLGYGVCLEKFTGARGKAAASDARAEYVGEIRRMFNAHNVAWQMTEIGKVDEGGGGTVAKYLAIYGMDIIDCGVPVLSMHSPFEVTSKADIFETYKAYRAFVSTP
ncbi:MAG: aminopeptidase [Thermodesulfobacteriota bacterium]|nr:aminopeptidase [Thermodesulfobacteriota bacterium]